MNGVMLFTGKWMELEILALNRSDQDPERQTLHIFSHVGARLASLEMGI